MKKSVCVLIICALMLSMCSCSESGKITDNAAATTQKEVYKTYTGLKPLPTVDYEVKDSQNSSGFSEKKIEHAYGVAENEKPHRISVESQKFFAKKGYKAVTYDAENEAKVLYLTFDCGYENGYTSKILDTLKQKNVKAAFFCTLENIKAEPELIARMINEGHIVGNHSTHHPSFSDISRTKMVDEIEECENYLRKNFGYASKYFRFPRGDYSESALDLVGSMGYLSVFWSVAYEDWNSEAQKGKEYAIQKVTSRLHPGAVILLHSVSADNAEAIGDIIDLARENGYLFLPLDSLNLSYFN